MMVAAGSGIDYAASVLNIISGAVAEEAPEDSALLKSMGTMLGTVADVSQLFGSLMAQPYNEQLQGANMQVRAD